MVEFAIRRLFYEIHRGVQRPPHLLCHGYRILGIPLSFNALRIECLYPNANVATLKSAAWTKLLGLLGSGGDRIMLDLILYCGVFVPAKSGQGNLIQISGA